MKERFRDKTRDDLANALNLIGVKAEMADRERAEEKVENSWYQRSLGVIDIAEGPISWINILKKDPSKDSPPRWWIVMGIPDDSTVSIRKQIKIKTKRKKSFPLFGKVIDVAWAGKDGGTGLAKTISDDTSTKTLATRIGNLEIKSQTEMFQGWTLTADKQFSPTRQEWETIEKTAGYILSSPRSL